MDSDCSHEIKRHLLPGRKVMANLDSVLKIKDITLPTKVHKVKGMIFLVVRYGCERRLSAKELILSNCGAGEGLRVPWTARRLNQSILKGINPKYSLEGPMLRLKLKYSGHLMRTANSLEKSQFIGKDPDAGKDGEQEEKGATEDELVG